jgi:hypothetical protein
VTASTVTLAFAEVQFAPVDLAAGLKAMIDDFEHQQSVMNSKPRTVGDVLNADVLENLEPPPDEAIGQEAPYYMQLAQMIDRLQAGRSRQSIARAQDLVDKMWQARPAGDGTPEPLTVGEVLARAARNKTGTEPPPSEPAPEGPIDQDIVFAALIKVLKSTSGRPPPNWRELLRQEVAASTSRRPHDQRTSALQNLDPEPGSDVSETVAGERAASSSSLADANEAQVLSAEAPAVQCEVPPTPRIMPWPEQYDADLGEMPLEPGERATSYLDYFAIYQNQMKPITREEWKGVKAYVDSVYVEQREYKRQYAANGGKTPARIAYEQARARGDKTAVWFDWEGRGEYRQ